MSRLALYAQSIVTFPRKSLQLEEELATFLQRWSAQVDQLTTGKPVVSL